MSTDKGFPKIPKDLLNTSKCQWGKISTVEDKCTFIFTIENYSLLNKKNEESINSPEFEMEENKNIKWFLELFPDGYSKQTAGCVSLFIQPTFNIPPAIKIAGTSVLIGKDDKVFKKLPISYTFVNKLGWGFPKFLNKEELLEKDKFLNNDTMCIICTFTSTLFTESNIETKIIQVGEIRNYFPTRNNLALESNDAAGKNYEKMFVDDTYSDITFISEGKELKAHKCLLSVSSPVLASIFKTDDKVSMNNSVIVVTDISYEIMFEMLRFIYTQKVENLKDIAHELISVAAKYAITDLKNLCETSLCENINLDNVLKMAVIANINEAKKLKELAFNIIVQNKQELREKAEFKEMLEACPNFLEELFWILISKKD